MRWPVGRWLPALSPAQWRSESTAGPPLPRDAGGSQQPVAPVSKQAKSGPQGPVAGEGPVGIGLAGGGDRQAAPAVSSGTPPLEAARQNPPSPPPLAHQPGLTGASPQPCRHAFQAPSGGLWATPDCRQEALVLR